MLWDYIPKYALAGDQIRQFLPPGVPCANTNLVQIIVLTLGSQMARHLLDQDGCNRPRPLEINRPSHGAVRLWCSS